MNHEKPIDYDIENFWLGFKQSMINFYKKNTVILSRPIDKWCEELNKLQSQKKYIDIENSIIKKICLYAIDLLRCHDDYNICILITNIKRWDKISIKYKFYRDIIDYNNDNNHNNTDTDINNYHIKKKKRYEEKKACNFVIILVEIYNIILKKNIEDKSVFDDIEIYLIFHNYMPLVNYAIKNNLHSILDKLFNYDIEIYFKTLKKFNLLDNKKYIINKNIPLSGTKFIKLINQLNLI